jgi:hypothetical protein
MAEVVNGNGVRLTDSGVQAAPASVRTTAKLNNKGNLFDISVDMFIPIFYAQPPPLSVTFVSSTTYTGQKLGKH